MNSKSVILTLKSPEDAQRFLSIAKDCIASQSRPPSGCTTGILLDRLASAQSVSTVDSTAYQAIVTKYLCPTNYRGSRVKASCEAGSKVIFWDDELDVPANHLAAAQALAQELGWTKEMIQGALPEHLGGYCFVFTSYPKLDEKPSQRVEAIKQEATV